VTVNLAELGAVTKYSDQQKSRVIEADSRVWLRTQAVRMRDHLLTLGALVTAAGAARLIVGIEHPDTTWDTFANLVDEIGKRLEDELAGKQLLCLTAKEEDYFNPRVPLFDSNVDAKFAASAAFDIAEAGKCLALGRSTAAVFHLMRTTETGIRATATCLGIPDPVKPAARNWSIVLKTIKAEVDRRNGATPAIWSDPADREFFEEVYVSLDAIRNPWRNATMHVENKYTEDEAEHILAAVKGFMKKLASRCDEEGKPLA
jgi:hypothetical protein